MSFYENDDLSIVPWRPPIDRFVMLPRFIRLTDVRNPPKNKRVPKKPEVAGAQRMLRIAIMLVTLCLIAVSGCVVFLIVGQAEKPQGDYSLCMYTPFYNYVTHTQISNVTVFRQCSSFKYMYKVSCLKQCHF